MLYLLKGETTWNDLQEARNNLKLPATIKKRPERIYNNLKQHTTSKNDLPQLTTSKKRPETTYNDLNLPTASKKNTWNGQQRADFEIILQYGAIRSLLKHVFHQAFAELQTFMHYHVYLLRDIEFAGYIANHYDTHKLILVKQNQIVRQNQNELSLT